MRLSNQDLVERLAKIGLETSDEWIVTRSGISARHFAADNQLTSDLAVKAAEAALEAAGCTSEDLDWLNATQEGNFPYRLPVNTLSLLFCLHHKCLSDTLYHAILSSLIGAI